MSEADRAHTPGRARVPLDDLGRIAAHLPCVHCGCDLRLYPATLSCPDCALPIADSLYGEYLQDAEPGYVRRLAEAAQVMTLGLALLMALAALAIIGSAPAAPTLRGAVEGAYRLVLALALLAPLLALIGLFVMATRGQGSATMPLKVVARRLRRPLLWIAPLIASAGAAAIAIPPLAPAILLAAWIIWPSTALLHHIEALMQRVPSPELARLAGRLLWLVGSTALGFVGVRTLEMFRPAPGSDLDVVALMLMVLTLLSAVTLAGLSVLLLNRVRALLWKTAYLAAERARLHGRPAPGSGVSEPF